MKRVTDVHGSSLNLFVAGLECVMFVQFGGVYLLWGDVPCVPV